MTEELFDCIFSKDTEKLRKMLAEGASPDTENDYGRSLLGTAAACNFVNVMEVLVEAGADVNKPNGGDLGYTPLMEAAREGRDETEALEFLIAKGANLEGEDTRQGKAVIHCCVSAHPTVLKSLLKHGADVDGVDVDGQTALHFLCRYAKGWGSGTITQTIDGVTTEMENPRFKEHTEMFNILLEHGADVNKLTTYGYSPLHLAAETDTVDFVKLLIEKGADVNLGNTKKFTPMHAASDRGYLEVVQALVEAGAKADVVDDDGFSPLLGATMAGSVELVRYLLEKGADKTVKAKVAYGKVAVGDTPLDVAKKMENDELVALLN